MTILIEIARRIFGDNPTKEQIEAVRHEFHHMDME